MFNDTINLLGLMEIPLRDRSYTWSNKRTNPTLVRLDRAFISTQWSDSFPSTLLSSLTSAISDHVPILLSISTTVPQGRFFRFDRSWALRQELCDSLQHAWSSYSCPDTAK